MDGGDPPSGIELLTRICAQLTRIADTLEALIPAPQPEPAPIQGCPHPEEMAVSLGVTEQGIPEWECRQCRTRFP